jgi:hypothetical protein
MATPNNCGWLRSSILAYVGEQTDVHDIEDSCVVTLPIKTVDNRWVDVYVEPHGPDFFRVHDAGKTTSELRLHGVKITETKYAALNDIAVRFSATLSDGSFVIGCKMDTLQQAIFSVGQCANLGMLELLKHAPNFREPPIISRIAETLEAWSSGKATIQSHVHLRGRTSHHEFDFVAHPLQPQRVNTVALRVLHPGYTPLTTARNFGFLSLDLLAEYSRWKKLAILTRSEMWTEEAISLVSKHAENVIRIESDKIDEEVREKLPGTMDRLQRAA